MQISLVLDTRASLLLDGWVGGSELHLLWKLKLEMDACTCADWLACACSTRATSYRVRVCPMLLSVTVTGGANQVFLHAGCVFFCNSLLTPACLLLFAKNFVRLVPFEPSLCQEANFWQLHHPIHLKYVFEHASATYDNWCTYDNWWAYEKMCLNIAWRRQT